MKPTQDAILLRHRLVLLLMAMLSPVIGILTVEIIRPIVVDVDYLGAGPAAPWFRSAVGVLVTVRLLLTANHIRRVHNSVVPSWLVVRELLLWIVVLPLSLLIGKILFTFIPPWDPIVGCVLVPAVAVYFLAGIGVPQDSELEQTEFRRGARLISLPEAQKRADALKPGDEPSIRWAGFKLPASVAVDNFCVVGGPGSGKTLMIRELMRSVLREIREGTDRRAIVYDVKADAISEITDMGISCPIRVLNPFDTRCVAWDMAADLRDVATADQYASILVPAREGEKDGYFTRAAQALLAGALKAFIISKTPWTLRDLIHVTATGPSLRKLLLSTPYTESLVDSYFHPPDTFSNILSTLANAMVPLQSVAAIWETLPKDRRFSLDRWCNEESSIVVLGNSFDRSATLTLLNQIIFRRLSELLLSGKETPTRWKAWFFTDELQEAGKLDGLRQLLTDGRSKGVRIVIGFQDIEGLRHVYDDHLANTLPAMCGNRSVLSLRSSFTAEWASDQIGEVENFEYVTSFGTSTDAQGNVSVSRNTTKNIEQRRAILPAEFMSFASSSNGNVFGLHSIPKLEGIVPRVCTFPLHRHRQTDDFSPRTGIDEMLLQPWWPEDYRRLGLPPPAPSPVIQVSKDSNVETKSALERVGRVFMDKRSEG